MKFLRILFTGVGIVAVIGVAAILAAKYVFPQGDTPGLDQVSLISQAGFDQVIASSKRIGGMLTWVFILVAVFMQIGAWVAATSRFRHVRGRDISEEEKLEHLEHLEVYFDLPLYFGLLGTVFSFILISIYPDTGLMFAYASTALGIVVSVILRLGYLTPYRQALTSTLYAAHHASTSGK